MARKVAERVHNEYFQPVCRTSCPCGSNSVRGRAKYQVYAWGEYSNAKWRTVDYFCELCFQSRVQARLIPHAAECGCRFQLLPRSGHGIPSWIKMPDGTTCKAEKVVSPTVSDKKLQSILMSSAWEQGMKQSQEVGS